MGAVSIGGYESAKVSSPRFWGEHEPEGAVDSASNRLEEDDSVQSNPRFWDAATQILMIFPTSTVSRA